jgi:hypothetical protein
MTRTLRLTCAKVATSEHRVTKGSRLGGPAGLLPVSGDESVYVAGVA